MKKLLIVIVGIYISLLVSGCGGGSSRASDISESRYYVIVRDMPAGKCKSSSFVRHSRSLGAINVFTEEHNSTITCESYGGSRQCVETVDTDDDGSMYCLVGFDGVYRDHHYYCWGDDWWLDDGWDSDWGDDWWFDDGWSGW